MSGIFRGISSFLSTYSTIFLGAPNDVPRNPALIEDFSAPVWFSKMCRHTELETRNMIISEYKGEGQVVKFSLGAGGSVKPWYRRRTRSRHRGRGDEALNHKHAKERNRLHFIHRMTFEY
jgi:hypothetical protein